MTHPLRLTPGEHAMVATSEPLAAKIGLAAFKKGGNAIDAALATAIALTVTEPTSNGIGSDAFALIEIDGQKIGFSSSGASPKHLRFKTFSKDTTVPRYGHAAVTTPGAVKLWAMLSERYGQLPFKVLFEDTIHYAEQGFRLAPTVQANALRAHTLYQARLKGPLFDPFFATFFFQDLTQEITFKDHAKTLRELSHHPDSLYSGALMHAVTRSIKKTGGYLTPEDFLAHTVLEQTPLKVQAHGATLYELPPNGQGMIALKALQIQSHVADDLHHQIESLKQAFVAGKTHLSGAMDEAAITAFLDPLDASQLAAKITLKASDLADPFIDDHGTVYLATADSTMSVSFIQSNYMGYGSGIVIPGTGIALQNRGANFLLKDHPNQYAPFKKPYHTLMPGFLETEDARGPLGVMGGFMQPQGHYQVFMHHVLHGLNIQEALNAPRYYYDKGTQLMVEQDFSEASITALQKAGHTVKRSDETGLFGRGQIILNRHGQLEGATEKRCDGTIETF